MATGQLLVPKLNQMLEETTLSSQQKSSVSTEMKSCMSADLSDPNLPLYIDGFGKKPGILFQITIPNFVLAKKLKIFLFFHDTDPQSGNTVSVIQTTMCVAISLVKNVRICSSTCGPRLLILHS